MLRSTTLRLAQTARDTIKEGRFHFHNVLTRSQASLFFQLAAEHAAHDNRFKFCTAALLPAEDNLWSVTKPLPTNITESLKLDFSLLTHNHSLTLSFLLLGG
jgi:hypothetical protein